MLKSVYIIILNWNGYNDTIECVKSCLNLNYQFCRIIIVDNCSNDGSELILKKSFPQIVVLQSGSNLGYAGGNNLGIRYAIKEKADYIWLLNNDTVVDPLALTELVNAVEMDPANGMSGSKILYYSDPSLIHYAGGWVDIDLGVSGHIGIGQKNDQKFDSLIETDYITGCSLLVKRSVIEDIGLMDEAYFLYYEESEWCINAKRNGHRLIYVPKSVVYHKVSVSTGKIHGAMTYYITRNRLYFISRNGTDVKWFKRFSSDLINLFKFIFKLDIDQVKSMSAAYWHWINGYRGCRESLYKQSTLNNYSKYDDNYK